MKPLLPLSLILSSVLSAALLASDASAEAVPKAAPEVKKAETKAADAVKKAGTKAADAVKKAETKATDTAKKVETKAADTAKKVETKAADTAKKAETKAADTAKKVETKAVDTTKKDGKKVEAAGKPAAQPAPEPAPVAAADPVPAMEEETIQLVADENTAPRAEGLGTPAPDPASTTNEPEAKPVPAKESKPRYKRSTPIKLMILTSNYDTPRFLAEKALETANCPIIIIPENTPVPDRGTPLTFKAPGKGKELTVKAEDLSRFLAFTRPLNLIILGNLDVVPEIYRLAVPETVKVIHVDDRAWKLNAVKLDNILNTDHRIYNAYCVHNQERAKAGADEEKSKEEPVEEIRPAVTVPEEAAPSAETGAVTVIEEEVILEPVPAPVN